MHKKLLILFAACQLLVLGAAAQELNARVTVISNRVGTTVDRKIFTNLQQQLTNLLNTRKWTNETYKVQEKIDCSFIINIEQVVEPNIYKATLTVQAARTIYNASYKSAIVNSQVENLTFKYIEVQPVEVK